MLPVRKIPACLLFLPYPRVQELRIVHQKEKSYEGVGLFCSGLLVNVPEVVVALSSFHCEAKEIVLARVTNLVQNARPDRPCKNARRMHTMKYYRPVAHPAWLECTNLSSPLVKSHALPTSPCACAKYGWLEWRLHHQCFEGLAIPPEIEPACQTE